MSVPPPPRPRKRPAIYSALAPSHPAQPTLAIELRDIAALKLPPRQLRRHTPKQLAQIAASIAEFGFVNPILVDSANCVVAGVGRLEAAKTMGRRQVPTVCLSYLSESQIRAYRVADNRLAELSGWDDELLRLELGDLANLTLDFDLDITGFDTAALDVLLYDPSSATSPDDTISEPAGPAVSRLGDLWQLGRHRLLCADARDLEAYKQLLDGQQAQMVFTDPPYNVQIQGHVSGLGKVQHREFAMASGEMSEGDFTNFLGKLLDNLAAVSTDGAIQFVCMDWRHMHELLQAGRTTGLELKNLCIWNKDNGGMGSFYRSKHELVFVFKNGSAAHINNFGLGSGGRYRTNVWDYAGVNSFRHGRNDELGMHPTVKPTALVMDAIKDCSRRGGVILDPFGGSGTTLIAAERTGRSGHLMEIDPLYVDVILRRWQTCTGDAAVHVETGMTLEELTRDRAVPSICDIDETASLQAVEA